MKEKILVFLDKKYFSYFDLFTICHINFVKKVKCT